MGSHPCAWPLSLATKRCRMPKNTYSGSHRDTFAQGLPKNEFSLGTHQAGRVPTWSLYNTHGVAPLRLAPFLGYTGVIPMLIHSQNTSPHPPLQLVPTVSLKNEFSQDTHLPCRVPIWSLYITHGVAPLRLAPVSGNEALSDAQKHLFWVPPRHFRQRSP